MSAPTEMTDHGHEQHEDEAARLLHLREADLRQREGREPADTHLLKETAAMHGHLH